MNEIMTFSNSEFGQIRTVTIDGEPWFVAKDISDSLGYTKTFSMTKLIDDEDRRNISSSVLEEGSKQSYQIGIVNESGLYAAIFGSKLESAQRFKKWVTKEVLPTIRKTGTYNAVPVNEQIPVGEVASYLKVMDRVAVRQNTVPYKIAQAFKMVSEQFGIQLPADFVNMPEYEQMSLEFSKGGGAV